MDARENGAERQGRKESCAGRKGGKEGGGESWKGRSERKSAKEAGMQRGSEGEDGALATAETHSIMNGPRYAIREMNSDF